MSSPAFNGPQSRGGAFMPTKRNVTNFCPVCGEISYIAKSKRVTKCGHKEATHPKYAGLPIPGWPGK